MTATGARPTSIGEILKRAIALYVRRFVPLFVILAVFAIPAAVLGAATAPDLTHLLQLLGRIGSLPAGDTLERARLLNEFNHSAPGGWPTLYFNAFALIFYPLSHTALIVFAAGALDGAAPTIASAYRFAVRRWLPQIAVACGFLAIALMVLAGFAIVGVIVGIPILAIGFLSKTLERIAISVAGLIAFAGAIVVFAVGFVAWRMAAISVAVDDGNPVRALVRGLRRTLDRPLLRRTLAVALTVIAFEWCGSLAILACVALIEYFTHLTALALIVDGSGGVVLDGLSMVFVLLYMRDVQLRREGYDLLLAATADTLPSNAADGADGLDAGDRALIAQFLARRATLEPRAADEIAARIAARVRPKLRASFHYLNDVDLLEHLGR